MSYNISLFHDPDRIPELIELFRTGLGDTTEEHWKWRLFADNGMEEKPFAVIAEDENDKIVGVISVLPAEYYVKNKTYRAYQIGDWVISPIFRGKGLAKLIYQSVRRIAEKNGIDFFIGFPNENSRPILLKYGFTELEPISCWNTVKKLFMVKRKGNRYTIDGTEYIFSDTCPLTEAPPNEYGRIIRTPELLRWKYDDNPTEKFTWLTVRKNNSFLGYFVFTQTKGRFRTAVNVYDWAYWSDSGTVFHTAVRLLLKNGNYVSFWGKYSAQTETMFEKIGMKKSDGGTRLVMKAVSDQGWPEPLYLTRIDTDY